jgi:carboxyl-terminal processing protease
LKTTKFPQFPRTLRASALAALLFLLTLSGTLSLAQAQSLNRIERERAQTMLGVIKGELKKNYYDPNFKGVDIEARFKQADEKLKQATSLGQAFGIVAQALLDLNDSHTVFVPPSRPVRIQHGWRMQMIGDKAYIVAVRPGSNAEKQGLKRGDLVLSVENFRPTRKELWKMDYYYHTLSPRPGLRVVVQSPGGEPRQLDIAANVKQEKTVMNLFSDFNELIREAEDSERVKYHRFQKFGGLVVWNMPGFDFEPEQADKIMTDDVKGRGSLILDLRGNGGGYVATLERLVGHFFDREIKIADRKGRKEMKPMLAKKRSDKPFDGKLVVLIDSKSASAAEIFARLVQIEKRGIVIGDQSSGMVMQSRFHEQEMGADSIIFYGVSITNADVIMSDGKSVEHIGVVPDELVLPTAADMAAGRDPVLARAAEILGVQLTPEKAGAFFPLEWK